MRFAQNPKRVDQMFGHQQRAYLDALKKGIENRIRIELGEEWDLSRLKVFAESRANEIRLSKLQSIKIVDPEVDLADLFNSLVHDEAIVHRLPRVTAELRRKFEQAGVSKFLRKPKPIELPQGVTIEVPYAYQNGAFNLIDPVRLAGNSSDALAQASKRAVQGQWLKEFSVSRGKPAQLVVVGEVAQQEPSFVNAVKEMMADHSVKFYEMKSVEQLVQDIKIHGPENISEQDALLE